MKRWLDSNICLRIDLHLTLANAVCQPQLEKVGLLCVQLNIKKPTFNKWKFLKRVRFS